MKERIEKLKSKESYKVDDLREIMEILRSEEGCPWENRLVTGWYNGWSKQ